MPANFRPQNVYLQKGSELEYVQRVLLEPEDSGRQDLVRRGTMALLDLSLKEERGTFIPIHRVRMLSGIWKAQSKTAGLWPWLEGHTGVIEKKEGQRAYRIKDRFYDAIRLALSNF